MFCMGDQKMEGKYAVKTWTEILAEMFSPQKQQEILMQQDSSERENERKLENKRE